MVEYEIAVGHDRYGRAVTSKLCEPIIGHRRGERHAPFFCRPAYGSNHLANAGNTGGDHGGAEGDEMKHLVLISLMIPVAASFSDLKQQLAKCEIEAAKVYPSFMEAPPGQPLTFIQLCMKAAGYDWAPPRIAAPAQS